MKSARRCDEQGRPGRTPCQEPREVKIISSSRHQEGVAIALGQAHPRLRVCRGALGDLGGLLLAVRVLVPTVLRHVFTGGLVVALVLALRHGGVLRGKRASKLNEINACNAIVRAQATYRTCRYCTHTYGPTFLAPWACSAKGRTRANLKVRVFRRSRASVTTDRAARLLQSVFTQVSF